MTSRFILVPPHRPREETSPPKALHSEPYTLQAHSPCGLCPHLPEPCQRVHYIPWKGAPL